MQQKSNYTMGLLEAGKVLNKATRSVQRYIAAGRLSRIYIHTKNGKSVRLNPQEVEALNRELHGLGVKVANQEEDKQVSNMQDIRSSKDSAIAQELVSRYEQAMFKLGQLHASGKQIPMLEEKAASLQAKVDILKHKNFDLEKQNQDLLNNLRRKVNELDDVRQRRLTFIERLVGRVIER